MRSEKCEVWTVKFQVWSVKCGLWSREVWSVKWEECSGKCEVWSVKCEVELQMWHVKEDTTFAECTHALAWLAHGACKFYRWERSYIYISLKATSAPPRAGTTGISYKQIQIVQMHIWCSTYFLKGFCRIVSSAWGSSSWTSHTSTAYSICCITSWCQDENHEDCLCPDKNFHSKHLRNLFLIEVFYYLNSLHTAWKTCTQYWTPNLESRNTIPCFLATWGTTKISDFSGCHGLPIFEKLFPAYQSVSHHSQNLGQVRVGTHGVACFLRIAGGLLHRKHTIVMANVIHHENII